MKICTWNVNGIRSLVHNGSEFEAIRNKLDCDIMCFQETRIGQKDLYQDLLLEDYKAYYNFCQSNGGYSGVAAYVKKAYLPDQVYSSIIEIRKKLLTSTTSLLKYNNEVLEDIDKEGRTLLLVYENCWILTVYFPTSGDKSESRLYFRRVFYDVIKLLIEELATVQENVILLGDFNTFLTVHDAAYCEHEEGDSEMFLSLFEMNWWLKLLLLTKEEDGLQYIDTFRYCNPKALHEYTCWNTKSKARQNNYGSRIDMILVSSSLQPTINECVIRKDLLGSDHAPVVLTMEFVLKNKTRMEERPKGIETLFALKQQKLSNYFNGIYYYE